jgi:CBS domain
MDEGYPHVQLFVERGSAPGVPQAETAGADLPNLCCRLSVHKHGSASLADSTGDQVRDEVVGDRNARDGVARLAVGKTKSSFPNGGDMKVCQIMTPDVEVAAPDDRVQTAAGRMRDSEAGVLPVCDSGRLVGMITDRDITVRV